MTDLQNAFNPNNNFEAAQPIPAPENNTHIDLSSTLNPGQTTPSMEGPSVVMQTHNELATETSVQTNLPNNAPTTQNTQGNNQNVNPANKEKLMQILNSERIKGKKAGFTRGILSGVALTLCIVVASAIFAKDQVIDFLSSDKLDFLNLNANVVSLTDDNQNTNNEESLNEEISEEETIVDEEISDETIVDEETSDETIVDEETSDETVVDEETSDETVVDEEISDETVVDEEISDETVVNEETSDETVVDEETPDETVVDEETSDETVVDEETSDETVVDEKVEDADIIGDGYTLKYVNTPEEANWVLSPKCDDVFCQKDKESIVLCNEFRLYETLSDDAPRVGNSGICRYKDASELAYITLK